MFEFDPNDIELNDSELWDENQDEIEFDDWFESEDLDDDYE
ncbi:hypothetical protein [Photobacterium rosenbergii]|uniref:Uncharacterized protein n=1 Tax=Photobacterium rosenbergii TaxID=294936 RepID=A0ABU3ZBF5_9GAMM|nr:hypothetical protein [Photobacterium rosenbergii]MDV5167445.1 hypothetical protein [Photobacterium rosenbergii]